MKKLLLISVVLMLSATLYSQVDSTRYVYCDLLGYQNGMTKKVTVTVDLGKTGIEYKDDAGKPVVFNSMIDGMNFMANKGWELVQSYIVIEGYGNNFHWILKKRKYE